MSAVAARAVHPLRRAERLVRPPFALKLLLAATVLYLAFGKGFAYAGWPPVFVGEVLLACVIVAAVRSGASLPRNGAALVTAGLLAVAAVQFADDALAGAAPFLEVVRGLAPVYYAGFAFGGYALLRAYEERAGRVEVMAATHRAVAAVTPLLTTAVFALSLRILLQPTSIPRWPISGGPLLLSKPRDLAVALAVLAPLLLARSSADWLGARARGRSRVLLVMWGAAAILVAFRNRGALLGLLAGLVTARPNVVRLAKWALVVLGVVLLLYVSGVRLDLRGREVSYAALEDTVASVLGGEPADGVPGNLLATRSWREDWWRAIGDDVRSERMVLHGHGWGDNMALRYGVTPSLVVDDPRVLRLPHNFFFSLAGRAGLVMAVGVLLVPVMTVWGTFREPQPVAAQAARGGVAAAVTTALTDVYIESPQGGIVFWTLVGFLWWATARPLDRPAGVDTQDGVWSSKRRE